MTDKTVRKGARVALGASILYVLGGEIGLLWPVFSTFGASVLSLSGLFGFTAIRRGFRSEPPRTRTWNLEIKSLLLCQLS